MEVEYRQIGQYRFAVKKRKPFAEFLVSNDISQTEWGRMEQWQKENVLLMYKWGSESNKSNKSAEVTRQQLLRIFETAEELPETQQSVYELYKADERHIMQIRKDFGIIFSSEARQKTNKVKEMFTKPLAKKMSRNDWD